MNGLLTAFALLGTAVLFCGGVLVLAVGARLWMRAASDAHGVRAHAAQAGEMQEAIDAAGEAVSQLQRRAQPYVPPSDADLESAVMAERELREHSRTHSNVTTLGNDGMPDVAPTYPEAGLYNLPERPE